MQRLLTFAFLYAALALWPAQLIAAAPAGEPEAGDPITLVIHSAADCPVCKAWRESRNGLPLALKLQQESPQIKVVIIERASLHGSESEALYPPELQSLFKARQARYQLSPPVPLFELVRKDQLISRHAGLDGWSRGTLPEIRRLQASFAASSPGR